MLTTEQRVFLQSQRVATLATADRNGAPHAVPVCFLPESQTIYIAIDEKPKRTATRALKRLRNIAENPKVALVADHYDDENWTQLGWVMVRGTAEILNTGPEYASAQALLKKRYAQYADMTLDGLPVIAIHIERVTSWGNLESTIS